MFFFQLWVQNISRMFNSEKLPESPECFADESGLNYKLEAISVNLFDFLLRVEMKILYDPVKRRRLSIPLLLCFTWTKF